jgi:hypothetical protein
MVQCTKGLIMIAAKGKTAVANDAEADQRLLDVAARADPREGIRQGLEDTRKGKIEPARKFFEGFEAERSLSK